jgi:hypothetical protein
VRFNEGFPFAEQIRDRGAVAVEHGSDLVDREATLRGSHGDLMAGINRLCMVSAVDYHSDRDHPPSRDFSQDLSQFIRSRRRNRNVAFLVFDRGPHAGPAVIAEIAEKVEYSIKRDQFVFHTFPQFIHRNFHRAKWL